MNDRHISRHRFLKAGALSTTGFVLETSFGVLRSWALKSEPIEAIVIGSGFGGAVAALRLAEAGIHPIVLERGRRWSVTEAQNTFATLRNPDGRSSWLSPTAVVVKILPPLIFIRVGSTKQGL